MPLRRTGQANKLYTQERVNLAKQRMSKVVDHLLQSLAMNENNQIVLYSDVLLSQIGKSHAANAFNLMRDSLFRYSIIRLCAIWEPDNDLETESICTVVDLIDDHNVILELMRETCSHWAGKTAYLGTLPAEPELSLEVLRQVRESEDRFGRTQGFRTGRTLLRAIASVREISQSDDMKVIRQLRNKHLAHALNETREEKKTGPVRLMKYREETRLLEKTISIVNDLYCWVNGASFDFEGSIQMRREDSEALWKGCQFKPFR